MRLYIAVGSVSKRGNCREEVTVKAMARVTKNKNEMKVWAKEIFLAEYQKENGYFRHKVSVNKVPMKTFKKWASLLLDKQFIPLDNHHPGSYGWWRVDNTGALQVASLDAWNPNQEVDDGK